MKKTHGFTIIELIIAVTIMGIAMGGMASLVNNISLSSKHLDAKMEANELVSQLLTSTYFPANCDEVLRGMRLPNSSSTLDVNKSDYSEGLKNIIKNLGSLEIDKVIFSNVHNSNIINASGNRLFTFTLRADIKPKGDQHAGVWLRSKDLVSLIAEVDSSGTIATCYNAGTQDAKTGLAPKLCDVMGLTFNSTTQECEQIDRYLCETRLNGTWKATTLDGTTACVTTQSNTTPQAGHAKEATETGYASRAGTARNAGYVTIAGGLGGGGGGSCSGTKMITRTFCGDFTQESGCGFGDDAKVKRCVSRAASEGACPGGAKQQTDMLVEIPCGYAAD